MDIISLGRLRPHAVEKGHLGSQSLQKGATRGNAKKKRGLADIESQDERAIMSTRTSKDYFLRAFKVKIAGFSFLRGEKNPERHGNKKGVITFPCHALNYLKIIKLGASL
jgi:hypothetical protein